MKQVIEAYGKALLEAAAVVLLMILLFAGIEDGQGNRGMLKMIGAKLSLEDNNYQNYKDFNRYKMEGMKPAPVITYNAEDLLHTGNIVLSSCISAADYNGIGIPFRVIQIQNPAGEDVLGRYNADSTEVDLPDAGIYVVEVSAMDDNRKETVCKIRLPVNQ